MVDLRDTHRSATLHSTLRCSGVLFRQAESMFVNILMMLDSLQKSCVIWLDVEVFSNYVLHYAASLRGTRHYWFKQQSRLIAMVDTLGLPTIFFTHSAADFQWPELAHLICPDDTECSLSRNKAVLENPAIVDCFLYHHIQKIIEAFYVGVLGATDYWMRFE